MMELNRKSIAISEVKLVSEDDQSGTFEGYASLFGEVDSYNDTIAAGAYAKTLASGMRPKMLWQHDTHEIIGIWDELREDSKGLKVRGRLLLQIPMAQKALALMKAGALDGLSIGFRAVDSERIDSGVRLIKEIKLYEISLVTFPAQETATVSDVKGVDTIRDLEKRLRDAGFSKSQACAIASHGFKGLSRCDADTASKEADALRDANAKASEDLVEILKKLRSKIHA